MMDGSAIERWKPTHDAQIPPVLVVGNAAIAFLDVPPNLSVSPHKQPKQLSIEAHRVSVCSVRADDGLGV